MSWSASKVFMAFLEDAFEGTQPYDVDTDNLKAALFNDSITPSQTAAAASTCYGAGAWASGGVSDASGWPAVGRQLLTIASGFSSNVYTFSAANTVSANGTTTLAACYGTLIYDDTLTTPADQGVCYNYFGGPNSVTNGTFTIVWNGSGIWALTM